jgi:hypothetical protein
VHSTLDLRARRAQLKADPTISHAALQLPPRFERQYPGASAATRRAGKAKKKVLDAPFILHVSRNALRDLETVDSSEKYRVRGRVLVHVVSPACALLGGVGYFAELPVHL